MENSVFLRKRLVFLADRRSMAEMERILLRFLADCLPDLADDACHRVMDLLQQQSDPDLLDWLGGLKEPPENVDREVLAWIAPYCAQTE